MNTIVCTRCVMDISTKYIAFDEKGVCNYCRGYDELAARTVLRPKEVRYAEFEKKVEEIKSSGKGKPYDCILGLSGGVDSSYMALVAKDFGLRPLIVHFDNGWDDELAVKNIENIVNKLGFDIYTYVIEWEQFKDLQLAYFKASVIDIETPTDQLIFAALYKIAKERKIDYILSGNNIRTEFIMPRDWVNQYKRDSVNLRNIHDKYGTVPLKNFPRLSGKDVFWYTKSGIKLVDVFDRLDFNLQDVKGRLVKELEWRPYPGKHYESVFTRFYQGYILPVKFGVDKRRAHFSNLICSGQMTRDEALNELKKPGYPQEQFKWDFEYVLKKWEISTQEFEQIMKLPPVPHSFFGFEKPYLPYGILGRIKTYLHMKLHNYRIKSSQ